MHAEKIKIFSRSVQQFCLLQWVSIRSIRFSSIANAIDLTQSYPSVTIVGEEIALMKELGNLGRVRRKIICTLLEILGEFKIKHSVPAYFQ